jgi:hypothetical protein
MERLERSCEYLSWRHFAGAVLTKLFPPLSPGEYAALKASIAANGLREPIKTWRGAIVDGKPRRGRPPDVERRRFAAALRAQGLTFAEIGRRLGITRQAAWHLVEGHKRRPRRGK